MGGEEVGGENHCCQMAEFSAAGLKNGPVKLLAAYEISGLESGRIS
jgi:hypothetical protein